MKKRVNNFPWIPATLFATGMGMLEAIVVVYLRKLYYPEGFAFPLKPMEPGIIQMELIREFATLLMLVTAGILAGKSRTGRFAGFIFLFGIWDITYYAGLKLLLGWPESLLSWDILFLIPTTWVGPVLAPLINSFCMILLAIVLVGKQASQGWKISHFEWALLITGSLIVILSYTEEYSSFMLSRYSLSSMLASSNSKEIMDYACRFMPEHFNWGLYLSGVAMHCLAGISMYLRK